jgi:hypothetical protein
VTTPHLPSRRSGWAVLLAVAGVVVGGAFAVRLRKRKRAGRPAPPGPPSPVVMAPARPVAPGSSSPDPSQSLVRMAIGGGIVVVLALVIVVATRPSDAYETTTPSPAPSGMYNQLPVPGLVGRDEPVALTGDHGARAELEIKRISGPQTEVPQYAELPGQRNLIFTIHIRNTGQVLINTRLDVDSWVLDMNGAHYRANQMLGGPYGSTAPGWAVDRQVAFMVPRDDYLIRLHVALRLGDSTPAADWNLQG